MCCCGSSLALALALEVAQQVEPVKHTLVGTATPWRADIDFDQSRDSTQHRSSRWMLRAVRSPRQLLTQWSASM